MKELTVKIQFFRSAHPNTKEDIILILRRSGYFSLDSKTAVSTCKEEIDSISNIYFCT